MAKSTPKTSGVVPAFVGVVGRQSKSKHGKQGIHHHPQRADLGKNLADGMPVGPKRSSNGGGEYV